MQQLTERLCENTGYDTSHSYILQGVILQAHSASVIYHPGPSRNHEVQKKQQMSVSGSCNPRIHGNTGGKQQPIFLLFD